jgi:hypothetical protein
MMQLREENKMNLTKSLPFMFLVLLVLVFPVFGASTRNIDVVLTSYSPSPVQPGQVMDLYLQVTKSADPLSSADLERSSYIDKPWIEIVEDYPFNLERSQDLDRLDSLGNVAFAQELQFKIGVKDDAKDGIYPLIVKFGSGDDKTQFYEETFDINVETFDAHISIESVTQNPVEIVPGSEGEILVSVRNNDDKPLRNIDVILDFTHTLDAYSNMNNLISMQAMINSRLEQINRRVASGLSPLGGATPMMTGDNSEEMSGDAQDFSAFAPIGSVTQKRIGVLNPGESADIVFNVIAKPNIGADIYSVPVFVNYNDDDNNPFHIQSHLGIVVNDLPELYVELESSSLRTVDFFGEISVVVANKGLTNLKVVELVLHESDDYELVTAPRSAYLGELKSGESKASTFTVVPNKDEVDFLFSVEYRDAFNKEQVTDVSIPFRVINQNFYKDPKLESLYAWLIIGVVMTILVALYLRAHFKNKE